MGKALVCVDHPGKINARMWVLDEGGVGFLGKDDGEGWGCNQVTVASLACGFKVVVEGVFGLEGAGEFADAFAPYLKDFLRRIASPYYFRVDCFGLRHTSQSI